MENAEFVKLGVMHRNTYINSSKLLDETYNFRNSNLYFAGQITGVEGYVESISSGMVAGLNAVERFKEIFGKIKSTNKDKRLIHNEGDISETKIVFSETTVIRSLS